MLNSQECQQLPFYFLNDKVAEHVVFFKKIQLYSSVIFILFWQSKQFENIFHIDLFIIVCFSLHCSDSEILKPEGTIMII